MRKVIGLLALLVSLITFPGLSLAQQVTAAHERYSFVAQAVGDDGVALGAVGRCRILTAGTFNTDATVYSDQNRTTAATTLTVTGYSPTIAMDAAGACKWYAPQSIASVDVIVYIDSGSYAGLRARGDGVTRQGLKAVQLNRGSPSRVKSIPFTRNTTTQVSTVQLPAGAMAEAATIEVTTAAAGGSVSFGAADPLTVSSFCNAQSTATAGFSVCSGTLALSTGTSAIALRYQTTAVDAAGFLNVFYVVAGGN
mgnify:FL=1